MRGFIVSVLVAALALSVGLNVWQFRALRAERGRISEATASLLEDASSYLREAEALIQDGATAGNSTSLLMAAERLEAVRRTLGRLRQPFLDNSRAIARAAEDLLVLSRRLWDGREALRKNGAFTAEQRDQLLEVMRQVERLRKMLGSAA